MHPPQRLLLGHKWRRKAGLLDSSPPPLRPPSAPHPQLLSFLRDYFTPVFLLSFRNQILLGTLATREWLPRAGLSERLPVA